MSSALGSFVASIVDNDHVTLVILTAIGYDYILTFSDEIEYVWTKPWTWVSTLFVLIRYFGLCGVTIYTLMGSSFLPGPAKTYVFIFSCPDSFTRNNVTCDSCEILSIFATWAFLVFIGSADMVMILRLWALYNRSRIILGILLVLYAAEIVPYIVANIITSTPGQVRMATVQVLEFSFCEAAAGPASPVWAELNDSLQFALSSVMCLLVIAQFVRQSFQMYKTTKTWQVGRYVNLFAREGVLYFLAILLFDLVNILVFAAYIPTTGWRALPIGILEYVPVFTLTPRFILTMRALYARDLRGRCGTNDMDTVFGLTSAFGRDVNQTAIVFAERGQDEEELGEDGAIPMKERGGA